MRRVVALLVLVFAALTCANTAFACSGEIERVVYGQRGQAVANVQACLTAAGYATVADGIYGPATQEAVDTFYAREFPGVKHGAYLGPKGRERLVALTQEANDDAAATEPLTIQTVETTTPATDSRSTTPSVTLTPVERETTPVVAAPEVEHATVEPAREVTPAPSAIHARALLAEVEALKTMVAWLGTANGKWQEQHRRITTLPAGASAPDIVTYLDTGLTPRRDP